MELQGRVLLQGGREGSEKREREKKVNSL